MKHATTHTTKDTQKGFTLVELLLALAVFSFVLVFVTTAFLQIFRTYNRGITRKEVNQNARALIGDITSKMRVVGDPSLVNATKTAQGRLCVGSYSYVWNTVGQSSNLIMVNGTQVSMVRIDGDAAQAACADPLQNSFSGVQATSMFTERVGMQSLTATSQLGGVPDLFKIDVIASTSDPSFLESLSCKLDSISGAYCAKVALSETVGLRNR